MSEIKRIGIDTSNRLLKIAWGGRLCPGGTGDFGYSRPISANFVGLQSR